MLRPPLNHFMATRSSSASWENDLGSCARIAQSGESQKILRDESHDRKEYTGKGSPETLTRSFLDLHMLSENFLLSHPPRWGTSMESASPSHPDVCRSLA